ARTRSAARCSASASSRPSSARACSSRSSSTPAPPRSPRAPPPPKAPAPASKSRRSRPASSFAESAGGELRQVLNEWPQPQLPLALGFLIVKPEPCSESTQSTWQPLRYGRLIASITTSKPLHDVTSSPDSFSEKVNPYCRPEQPPPCTKMRSALPLSWSSCL